jgi:hypothetical protein
VDWAAIAAGRPYCRAAAQRTGFDPAPDATALWWRDALWERVLGTLTLIVICPFPTPFSLYLSLSSDVR